MKILVTGSNGLLGQKIIQGYKHKEGIELIATARGENRMIDKAGYSFESMDITQADEVMDLIKRIKPDAVIHAAAMTNVDACETDKENCKKVNVDAVEYLVRACEKVDAHLIHVSTDFIFNGMSGPYDENGIPDPLSYYGWSKLEAEKIVLNAKCRWTILRTVLVIGVTEGMSRSNIVLWVRDSLRRGERIRVVNDQWRTPTLAEDLAQGCILAAIKEKEGVYNISGEEVMSILDIAYRVADHFDLDKNLIDEVSSETLNQPAKRPPRTGFIITKAKEELGYEPHSFSESISIIDSQSH
ncbi:MAG: SDR family oxidoreductase [Bacteroidota bacterium]|nr:SDR family oxidoreductase [Bacteroidota bacterium]MDX5447191.1 SDR family oxidoreductase [Bacteroidota bacterium]